MIKNFPNLIETFNSDQNKVEINWKGSNLIKNVQNQSKSQLFSAFSIFKLTFRSIFKCFNFILIAINRFKSNIGQIFNF